MKVRLAGRLRRALARSADLRRALAERRERFDPMNSNEELSAIVWPAGPASGLRRALARSADLSHVGGWLTITILSCRTPGRRDGPEARGVSQPEAVPVTVKGGGRVGRGSGASTLHWKFKFMRTKALTSFRLSLSRPDSDSETPSQCNAA